ncbi:MAG: glutamate-5-semialdehyde dehydrogenase, partial [Pirellulales bacterium]|nr:glutamate-5-semialdehyde dehydrogenase [Pirellulales bacterium]
DHVAEILDANQRDLDAAAKAKLPENLVARLRFGEEKVFARGRSLRKIAELPDPVGQTIRSEMRPNGLTVDRVRVPLGVILMVYEARPHVTVNAGAFCLKSGNASILRGGSEASNCNQLLGQLWQDSLADADLPVDAIQVISGSHEDVRELLRLDTHIDLVIPRGGKRLIEAVAEHSRIPVIKHYEGICHVYLDEINDLPSAVNIALDSKCLMPEVCNAAETLLVSRSATRHLATIVSALCDRGVSLRGCDEARRIDGRLKQATDDDWRTEYLDMVLSIRIVDGVEEAIEHINHYGSHHTDTIVTSNTAHAGRFVAGVDSAVVLVNASTMFCDGESLGMGAEIGISTDKLHARGPMGLEELTTYKFVIHGGGHVMGTWAEPRDTPTP